MELWIAGYPSFLGGADTELDHLIDLWVANGIEVHLVPFGGVTPLSHKQCSERGCATHRYRRGIFKGKTVVSLAHGWFLRELPTMARPVKVIWLNCTTWSTAAEKRCVEEGLIDLHLYHTEYQRAMLDGLGPRPLAQYTPYFNLKHTSQPFHFDVRPNEYTVGRISGPMPGKYPRDAWNVFNWLDPDIGIVIGGWHPALARHCGEPPARACVMDRVGFSHRFYDQVHVLAYQTGAARDNYPRVFLEAMASGVVVVTERKFGFAEIIDHGVTGYLCESAEEMVETIHALREDGLRRRIALSALARMRETVADDAAEWRQWEGLLS